MTNENMSPRAHPVHTTEELLSHRQTAREISVVLVQEPHELRGVAVFHERGDVTRWISAVPVKERAVEGHFEEEQAARPQVPPLFQRPLAREEVSRWCWL